MVFQKLQLLYPAFVPHFITRTTGGVKLLSPVPCLLADSGAFSHDPKKICCTSIVAVLQWRRFFEAAVTTIKANLR